MTIIYAAKADQDRLATHVGEDTAAKFFQMKKQLQPPYNNMEYWMNQGNDDLYNYLNSYQSKSEKKKSDKAKGAKLLADENGFKVYEITTYEASVWYGKNTEWCISGSKRWSNGERGEDYFNEYKENGVEFYFFIKSDDEKYAVSYFPENKDRTQVWNSEDDDIGYLPPYAPVIDRLEDTRIYKYKNLPTGLDIERYNANQLQELSEIFRLYEIDEDKISYITNPILDASRMNAMAEVLSLGYSLTDSQLKYLSKDGFLTAGQIVSIAEAFEDGFTESEIDEYIGPMLPAVTGEEISNVVKDIDKYSKSKIWSKYKNGEYRRY